MDLGQEPVRIINSVAPIRINDFGGWTDTWFAKFGRVLNIAVCPMAEVQMRVFERDASRPAVTIYAENYGERWHAGGGGRYLRSASAVGSRRCNSWACRTIWALEIDIFAAPAGGFDRHQRGGERGIDRRARPVDARPLDAP